MFVVISRTFAAAFIVTTRYKCKHYLADPYNQRVDQYSLKSTYIQWGKNTTTATTKAPIADSNTAPAATSLALPIRG